MEMTAVNQYTLKATQSFGSQDYYKKVSNDDTWASWCIILRERTGVDKIDYRMFRRIYLLGYVGKLGEFSAQQYVIE